MAFDFTAWVIGYSLTRVIDESIIKKWDKDFSKNLDGVVKKWAKNLPKDNSLTPEAIFPASKISEEEPENEFLIELRQKIHNNELPSKKEWKVCIVEQWRIIRSKFGDEAQGFFLIEEKVAEDYINDLSQKLYDVCAENTKMFKKKVISEIEKLKEIVAKQNSWIKGIIIGFAVVLIVIVIPIGIYYLLKKK